MHARTLCLLRYIQSIHPLGVCRTTTLPCDHPGVGMVHLRALERMGLVAADNGIWFLTEAGKSRK